MATERRQESGVEGVRSQKLTLTESQRVTITAALRIAVEVYATDARDAMGEHSVKLQGKISAKRIADQFAKQRVEALNMAEFIGNAESVEVTS